MQAATDSGKGLTSDEDTSWVLDLSRKRELELLERGYGGFKSNKKRMRTRLEKGLMLFLACLIVALIIFAVKFAQHLQADKSRCNCTADQSRDPDTGKASDGVCLTAGCTKTAARVIEALDTSIDPCEDFYSFACGGWIKHHEIPSHRGNIYAYGVIRDNVARSLKETLERKIIDADIESIQNVKKMYRSCIDKATIEQRNLTDIINFLESLGGWPLLDENQGGRWKEAEFNMVKLLLDLLQYNNQPIIPVWVGLDYKNNTRRILFVDQQWFGMPDRSYFIDPIFGMFKEAYRTLIYNVATLLGANSATLKQDVLDLLELETQLANISMSKEERHDTNKVYNKMTIADLQANFTHPRDQVESLKFDWFEFLQGALNIPKKKINITEEEEVILMSVPYFKNLFTTLKKFSKRTITNYMIWRIVKNRSANLPERFRDELFTYDKQMIGTPSAAPRWKDCVQYCTLTFEMVLGRMFVEEAFNNASKVEALNMIKNIKEAFKDLVKELDWMDENMKKTSIEKADNIVEIVGYPEYIFKNDLLNEVYHDMKTNEDEYFQNVLVVLQRDACDALDNLRTPNVGDRTRWSTAPMTVNAYYSLQSNKIAFPAGILQPPYFSLEQPWSMNYGGIGFMMGHEITHGFDTSGREYDKEGNMHDWWTPLAEKMFKQKAQCLVDQYSQFLSPVAEIYVNGFNTQNENIADNGGIKQAFRGYEHFIKKRGEPEPRLPGLNLTHEQLFFINVAQIRCGMSRKEDEYNHIINGQHSPNRFRVIGTMQNFDEFSKAFQCSKGSYMNPEKKCAVW